MIAGRSQDASAPDRPDGSERGHEQRRRRGKEPGTPRRRFRHADYAGAPSAVGRPTCGASPAQEPGDRKEHEQPGEGGRRDHDQDVGILEVSRREHHRGRDISLRGTEPEHRASFAPAEQKSRHESSQNEQDRRRRRRLSSQILISS